MLDGTRNDGKLSRSVRSRGKAGDNIKRLPIANFSLIRRRLFVIIMFKYKRDCEGFFLIFRVRLFNRNSRFFTLFIEGVE